MIHSTQIIDGNDVQIRWSGGGDGSVATYQVLESFLSYDLALQWQEKTFIPVGENSDESVKVMVGGKLNLSAVPTDRGFQLPEIVWIEIGLRLYDLPNGDRWQFNRTGKYRVQSETETARPDGAIELRYTLSSQGEIASETVLVPATRQAYFQESYNSVIQTATTCGSSELLVIL